MTTRRKLVIALGLGALSAALPILAQQPARTWRIGVLSIRSRPASFGGDIYEALLDGLRELGYVEGRNIAIEWRFADGSYGRLPGFAADLVRLKVDVILVVNVPVIRAAQQATTTIPIVMLTSSDPVASGFVASLARPGGNITGLCNVTTDLGPKYVELLRPMIPRLSRVAVLVNPVNPQNRVLYKSIQTATAKVGIKVLLAEAQTSQQIESAFAAMTQAHAGAVIVAIDTLLNDLRRQIAELAVRYRMPSMFGSREFVEAGGLMSYGQSWTDSYRRAAAYVDKIFKGAKPADLPIEQPTKFELVINRKTAKAIGLAIPQELLLRADRVIE